MNKATLLKIIPNQGEISLINHEPTIIDGRKTIVWSVYRDGRKLWVDMEEDNSGWCGRFMWPFDDCSKELKQHIYKNVNNL